MNPVPVAASPAVPARSEGVRAMGVKVGVESNFAGVWAAPPQSLLFTSAGETQRTSDHVKSVFFLSAVNSAFVDANDAGVKSPHEAASTGLKGTGTWCVTSTTESILPVPQTVRTSDCRRNGPTSRNQWRWLRRVLKPSACR